MTNLKVDANILSLEGIDQKIEAEKESKRIREEGKETKKKKRSPPWFYRKREQVFMIIHDMSIWVGSPSLHPSCNSPSQSNDDDEDKEKRLRSWSSMCGIQHQ